MKKPLSFAFILVVVLFLSEVFHIYQDLFYTFSFPHWNTAAFVGLFLFIWAPFMYNLRGILVGSKAYIEGYEEEEEEEDTKVYVNLFTLLFYASGSVLIRKFYKAITNGLVHLSIQLLESISIGYTFTNYFALSPLISHLTTMSVLALFFTLNHMKTKLNKEADGVTTPAVDKYILYFILLVQNLFWIVICSCYFVLD
jgi:hypothetical protein